jgi:hypothetical protein
MTDVNPQLVLLARLSEAVSWDAAVQRHETDAWAYLRRKLEATEEPLREFKQTLFKRAKTKLLADLDRPIMPPGAFETHKETFEALLNLGDYADLAFHLDPGAERESRREGAAAVLEGARPPTLFDYEALPAERRSRAWEKRVSEMSRRLDLEPVVLVAERGPLEPIKRARIARRLRRNLGEYLSVARKEDTLREEITPFMLARIEAAVAATLRLLYRWR